MKYKTYKNSHKLKNYGKKYDKVYRRDTYSARVWILEKEILGKIINKYFKTKINNYLDFACGTGRIIGFINKNAINAYGIDISGEMLKEARIKFKKINFILLDIIKNLNKFKQKFNLITSFRFFLNAEDSLKKKILKAISQLIDDNGIFVFNIHGNKNSIRHFAVFFRKLLFKTKVNETSYAEMEKLLNENNLRISEIYGLNFLPFIFIKFLPKKLWLTIEKSIYKLKFLNNFGIQLIFVSKKIT